MESADEDNMSRGKKPIGSGYEPGEVLALFTPLQELPTGLYLLTSISDGWMVIRRVIDNEHTEQLILTEQQARLPVALLVLFMLVGLQIPLDQTPPMLH